MLPKILASRKFKRNFFRIFLSIISIFTVVFAFAISSLSMTTVKSSPAIVDSENPTVIIDAGHGGLTNTIKV